MPYYVLDPTTSLAEQARFKHHHAAQNRFRERREEEKSSGYNVERIRECAWSMQRCDFPDTGGFHQE